MDKEKKSLSPSLQIGKANKNVSRQWKIVICEGRRQRQRDRHCEEKTELKMRLDYKLNAKRNTNNIMPISSNQAYKKMIFYIDK